MYGSDLPARETPPQPVRAAGASSCGDCRACLDFLAEAACLLGSRWPSTAEARGPAISASRDTLQGPRPSGLPVSLAETFPELHGGPRLGVTPRSLHVRAQALLPPRAHCRRPSQHSPPVALHPGYSFPGAPYGHISTREAAVREQGPRLKVSTPNLVQISHFITREVRPREGK